MATSKTIYVLNHRLQLKQPEDGFKTSIDAVLLAASCPAKDGDHVLDLGCGVGSAGLCLIKRLPQARLTGIDIQADHVAIAADNAALNKCSARAQFITADIQDFTAQRFDHVICNPPYLEAGRYSNSPKAKKAKAIAHTAGADNLAAWLAAVHRNLKSGGSLSLIHRADQIDKIILTLGKRFGATEIIPLWPKSGTAAKRVIIRTIKDRKSPATLHAGLVLHKRGGGYTRAAENILRGMQALL
jgi:tRNA1(Val) A37 N6-methylase TrmN6